MEGEGNDTSPETRMITHDLMASVDAVDHGPCVSLYQPTHRGWPDRQQDTIRYRNLVRQAAASLDGQAASPETAAMLEQLDRFADDTSFWRNTLDGVAVLAAPGVFHAVRLPETMPELAIVADSFHTRPLRRLLQSVRRFHVLALTRDSARVFEGSRHGLDELTPIEGIPSTLGDALGHETTQPYSTRVSYGGVGPGAIPARQGTEKGEQVDVDTERFFRAVDRGVIDHITHRERLPLILVALPEHQGRFRQLTQNRALIEEGVRTDATAVDARELAGLAWEALRPHHEQQISRRRDAFYAARERGAGSDDLEAVARAAAEGRVATLLIDSSRFLPGRLDRSTGAIRAADLAHPDVDDVYDDIGELVQRYGGEVWIVDAGFVPGDDGIAAIFRGASWS